MDLNTLIQIATGFATHCHVSRKAAIEKLGQCDSPDRLPVLITLLEDAQFGRKAYEQLSTVVDWCSFDRYIFELYKKNNPFAIQLIKNWVEGIEQYPPLPSTITVKLYKIPGLICANHACAAMHLWYQVDPLFKPDASLLNRIAEIEDELRELKKSNEPIALVVDQIDTSKVHAVHRIGVVKALLSHFQRLELGAFPDEMRTILFSQTVDPDFYDIAENEGALPLIIDTEKVKTGDVVKIQLHQKKIQCIDGSCINFQIDKPAWQSVWSVGNAVKYELARSLTNKAKHFLKHHHSYYTLGNRYPLSHNLSYTLAQKWIGHACGRSGVSPGEYCEPSPGVVELSEPLFNKTESIILSQVKGYAADLVLQGAHLESLSSNALILKSRDGQSHAWLNRVMVPNSFYMSSNRYTHSALGLGIGWSQTAYRAAVTGIVPLLMPESVLVRFYGTKASYITLRDMAHAIAYFGLQEQRLSNQSAPFTLKGFIVEIEGVSHLSVENAYELVEASIHYGGVACAMHLAQTQVLSTVQHNIQWLSQLMRKKHPYAQALEYSLTLLKEWEKEPYLVEPDVNATYAKTISINLEAIQEPLLAVIHQPNMIHPLSEAAVHIASVDAVWVGSTALSLDHYRKVATLIKRYAKPLKIPLWLAPPSSLELKALMQEGCYQIYGEYGVYTAMPESELCAQADLPKGSKVVATSGKPFIKYRASHFDGYITSVEVAVLTAILGRLPTLSEYHHLWVEERDK